MRFEKISADGFGCLKGWESPDIESDIVVVCGRNESGKSTLFKVAETLFYGWSPATVDRNPYVPWDESEASCSGSLVVGDKTLYIGRRLRNRPAGFLQDGREQIDIANRTLSVIEHIPREIYREVYALTSDELNMPSETLWERLKDQLLGGQYYSFIRPASNVMDELEDDANSLWRLDRRGKPRSKSLKDELSKLRKELVGANENDKRLYDLENKLLKSQSELDRLLREKVEVMTYIEWCEKVIPIKNKEEELRKLLVSAGDIDAFKHIPFDLEKELSQRDSHIKELREGIEDRQLELEKLDRIANSLTEMDIRLLDNKETIEELIRSYSQIARNFNREAELTRKRDRMETLLKHDGDELIIGGWKDVYTDSLKTVDEAVLRQRVSLYGGVKAKVEQKNMELSTLSVEGHRKFDVSKLIPSGVIFSAMGILGLMTSNSLLKFGGMLFLSIGLISFIFGWSAKDSNREQKKLANRLEKELKVLKDDLKVIQGEIHSCLCGIPFASLDEAYIGDSIIVDSDRLKRYIEALTEIDKEYYYIKSEINAKTDMVDRLMKDCRIERGENILVDIDRCGSALKAAKDTVHKVEEAKDRIETIEIEVDRLRYQLEKQENEREELILDLENFKGDNLKEKIEDLGRRRQLYSKAKLLEEQLNMEKRNLPDSCFKVVDRWYIEDRETDDVVLDFDELAYAKVKIEELDDKLNSLNAEIGALRKELEFDRYIKTAQEVKGEMEAIEEELRASAKERDRLIFLKNIIERADRQFREDHQPDVLNRASEYLEIITGGKYYRIFISEEKDDKVAILQKDNPYPIEVGETISRGTQEQIYLALRLAMMDHLDGEYPMPIFLDEVFINWDGMRTQNGLELVKKIGAKRQVFIFTCHSWLVDLLSDNLCAQVVVMDEIECIW